MSVPTIFCFANADTGHIIPCIAIAESGKVLAQHASSSPSWGHHDLGIGSTCKHDLYKAEYPDGYALEWVDDPRPGNNARFDGAMRRNAEAREKAEGVKS